MATLEDKSTNELHHKEYVIKSIRFNFRFNLRSITEGIKAIFNLIVNVKLHATAYRINDIPDMIYDTRERIHETTERIYGTTMRIREMTERIHDRT